MRFALLCPLAVVLLAQPALARQAETDRPAAQPVTEKNVTAGDVATTPLTDLNLRKGELPAALIEASERAYGLEGLGTCRQLTAAIARLDSALGEDVDLPQAGERRTSGGQLAQSVVGSFIPFRGVIREVSGANNRERQLQSAILSGVARRSFLKGIGQARGCSYPARSATLDVFNRRLAELTGDTPKAGNTGPVVQKTP